MKKYLILNVMLVLSVSSCSQLEQKVGGVDNHNFINGSTREDVLTLGLDNKTRTPAGEPQKVAQDAAIEVPKDANNNRIEVSESAFDWLKIVLAAFRLPVSGDTSVKNGMNYRVMKINRFAPRQPIASRPDFFFVYSEVVGQGKERQINGGVWDKVDTRKQALGFKAKQLKSQDFREVKLDGENFNFIDASLGLSIVYNSQKELPKKDDMSQFSVNIGSNAPSVAAASDASAEAQSIGEKFTPYQISTGGSQEFKFKKGDVLVLYDEKQQTLWLVQLKAVAPGAKATDKCTLTFDAEKISITEV